MVLQVHWFATVVVLASERLPRIYLRLRLLSRWWCIHCRACRISAPQHGAQAQHAQPVYPPGPCRAHTAGRAPPIAPLPAHLACRCSARRSTWCSTAPSPLTPGPRYAATHHFWPPQSAVSALQDLQRLHPCRALWPCNVRTVASLPHSCAALQTIQRTGPDLLTDCAQWAGVKRHNVTLLFPELTEHEGLGEWADGVCSQMAVSRGLLTMQ